MGSGWSNLLQGWSDLFGSSLDSHDTGHQKVGLSDCCSHASCSRVCVYQTVPVGQRSQVNQKSKERSWQPFVWRRRDVHTLTLKRNTQPLLQIIGVRDRENVREFIIRVLHSICDSDYTRSTFYMWFRLYVFYILYVIQICLSHKVLFVNIKTIFWLTVDLLWFYLCQSHDSGIKTFTCWFIIREKQL